MTRTMCIAAMCLLLSGCGETAYKIGGNTDEYRMAQKSCRDSSDESVYKMCMKQKGWTVIGIEGSVAGTPAEAMATAPETPAGPPVSATASPKSASSSATPSAGENEHAAAPKASPTSAPSTAAKTASPPLDPNEVVTVQSWWKVGAADFKTDVQACEALLGGNHRYDEVKKTATRAVVGCMRAKGWRAY